MTDSNSPPNKNVSNTPQNNQLKSSSGFSSFSFLNLLKPRSAGKIPKAAFQGTPKPSIKSPAPAIGTQLNGKKPIKKILILVIVFMLIIILILLIALFIKKRPEEAVGERGKLTWWGQRDEFIVEPLIKKFEEENPGVTIDYQKQDSIDYRVRLQNLIEKGEAPDIFSLHNSWSPMFVGDMATLPSTVIEKKEYENIFYPAIVSSMETRKGIIGIPIGYDALVLFINQDLFSIAFSSPPETWDDFIKVAQFLTDNHEGKIIQAGAAMGLTSNVDHWQEIIALLMVQNGVSLSKPTGERADEIYRYYSSFVGGDRGVWNDTLPNSVVAFANNKLAMLFAPSYRANDIKKVNPELRFIAVPVPQVQQADPTNPDITYATFWFEGVWERSVNSDIAWDFLKFLVDRDNQVEISRNYQTQGLVQEIFPRKDMRVLIKDDFILGPAVNLADYSVSWYLAGDAEDGEGGINNSMSNAFKIGIQGHGNSKSSNSAAEQVQLIFSKYGLTSRGQL